MINYYTSVESRSHAFLLERRLKNEGVMCELAYMPRALMTDLCSMGVKFGHNDYKNAVTVIRKSGLPGCRLYKEIAGQEDDMYLEVEI